MAVLMQDMKVFSFRAGLRELLPSAQRATSSE